MDHLAHRLVNLGLGQRGAVLVMYAFGIASGAVACLLPSLPALYANLIVGCFAVLGVVAILLLERAPFVRQDLSAAASSPIGSRTRLQAQTGGFAYGWEPPPSGRSQVTANTSDRFIDVQLTMFCRAWHSRDALDKMRGRSK